MRADGRVDRSRELKGNWDAVRLSAHVARLASPKLLGLGFTQRFSGLPKSYTNYKKKRRNIGERERGHA